MALYDSLLGMMDLQAAQVLVTSNDFADASFRQNLKATTEDLLNLNVVPIFNENDAISSRLQTNQVLAGLGSTCSKFLCLMPDCRCMRQPIPFRLLLVPEAAPASKLWLLAMLSILQEQACYVILLHLQGFIRLSGPIRSSEEEVQVQTLPQCPSVY